MSGGTAPVSSPSGAHDGADGGTAGLPYVRPKAPLKDRLNFLDDNVGAKVLASSDSMKGASNILNADRDRYMMTESQVKKKWVALSLIESMLLDTLVLANFEYYSCSPRRFQLLGSLEYPTKR